MTVGEAWRELARRYSLTTPQSLRLIDAYLVFTCLALLTVVVYGFVAASAVPNAFTAAVASTLGSFVLGGSFLCHVMLFSCFLACLLACLLVGLVGVWVSELVLSVVVSVSLRLQCNPENVATSANARVKTNKFTGLPEHAFAQFLVCHVVLHLGVMALLAS